MNSVCISNCIDDVVRVPMKRASYVNLYKWPESDAEFVRSVSSNRRNGPSQILYGYGYGYGHPTVVDSISCRQMFLRSYKFSRKETVAEKTHKCFQRVKRRLGHGKRRKIQFRKRKCLVWRKLEKISCSALFRLLQRLLSCSATGTGRTLH